MASTISAGTTAGTAIVVSGDTSGSLVLQTNGTTTAVTISTAQDATFAGKVTSAGALTLASNGTTTAVTIDTSQNVGIGAVSASGTTLTVKGTTASTNTGIVSFFKYLGTAASPTESLDWPTPVLSLRGYGDFTKESMLSFGYSNDANYQTGDGVWNFRLDGTASATSSTSSTNLNLLGPGALVLGAGSAEQARITSAGLLKFNSGYGSVATAYGCRAWCNFNGTGTVAIRASGNVSSITDNGTGDYTVNFTTAMPDANYSFVGTSSDPNDDAVGPVAVGMKASTYVPTTTARRFETVFSGTNYDSTWTSIAVFR